MDQKFWVLQIFYQNFYLQHHCLIRRRDCISSILHWYIGGCCMQPLSIIARVLSNVTYYFLKKHIYGRKSGRGKKIFYINRIRIMTNALEKKLAQSVQPFSSDSLTNEHHVIFII